jgi:hypothetical protein
VIVLPRIDLRARERRRPARQPHVDGLIPAIPPGCDIEFRFVASGRILTGREHLLGDHRTCKIFEKYDVLSVQNVVGELFFLWKVKQVALLIRPDHAPNVRYYCSSDSCRRSE